MKRFITPLSLATIAIAFTACSIPAMGAGFEPSEPAPVTSKEPDTSEPVKVEPEGQLLKEVVYVLGINGMD